MVKRCFVVNCKVNRKTEKISLFKAPNDEILLEEWRKVVPARERELTSKDCICERHFEKRYVMPRYQQSRYGDYYEDHIRPKLIHNAIPTIFNEDSKGKTSIPSKALNYDIPTIFNEDSKGKTSIPSKALNYDMLQTNAFKCLLSEVEVNENDIVSICYNCLLGKCKTHVIYCH